MLSHGPMRNMGFLGRWGTHACPQCLLSGTVPIRSWTRTLRRPGIRHEHLPCHATNPQVMCVVNFGRAWVMRWLDCVGTVFFVGTDCLDGVWIVAKVAPAVLRCHTLAREVFVATVHHRPWLARWDICHSVCKHAAQTKMFKNHPLMPV